MKMPGLPPRIFMRGWKRDLMSWFQRICRDVGLMIHHARHPEQRKERRLVRKDVEQERRGGVTLRRTTIEEIELHESRERTR